MKCYLEGLCPPFSIHTWPMVDQKCFLRRSAVGSNRQPRLSGPGASGFQITGAAPLRRSIVPPVAEGRVGQGGGEGVRLGG